MKLPDYSNCKIYRIVCKDLLIKDCYIGNTCNWTNRKCEHKRSINNESRPEYLQNKAVFIRENGGWENWDMVLIEDFPCKTKLEAHKRERYWIETLGATLNTVLPSRQAKEQKQIYYQQNKDHILQRCKAYVATKDNDTMNEYRRNYYENNKEKMREYHRLYQQEKRANK